MFRQSKKFFHVEAPSKLIKVLVPSKNYFISSKSRKFCTQLVCHINSRVNHRCNFLISNFKCSNVRPLYISRYLHSVLTEDKNEADIETKCYWESKDVHVKGTQIPRPVTKFDELKLPKNLMDVLLSENYPEPTPIQAQAWPVALSGRDMIGISQTGSGKTLAYILPAIAHIMKQKDWNVRRKERKPQVLVLGPTRELVQQIYEVSGKYLKACGLRGAKVFGGAGRIPQLNMLDGAKICIATPGRLLDYLNNREVSLDGCTFLVLDEADRMLDMGFEPQIREIVNDIKSVRQTLMWSATWPCEVRGLAEEFLSDYVQITVGSTELVANPNIQQNIYVMEEDKKYNNLFSLLTSIIQDGNSKVLVFVETKRKVDHLTKLLKNKSIHCCWGIHGDISQFQRDSVLDKFRKNTPSVLIATDIASRGLDISDIHHVINFDFPRNIEDYIHRIGRTARGSACGESHSFFTSENSAVLKELFSVLKKSNQPINPDLYTLDYKHVETPKRRFSFKRPYNRNRIY